MEENEKKRGGGRGEAAHEERKEEEEEEENVVTGEEEEEVEERRQQRAATSRWHRHSEEGCVVSERCGGLDGCAGARELKCIIAHNRQRREGGKIAVLTVCSCICGTGPKTPRGEGEGSVAHLGREP